MIFKSCVVKEVVFEIFFVVIVGFKVFLGDCENCLVFVKIYEVFVELFDIVVIG